MHSEQPASNGTPEECAADLMEAIHPIMQFIRMEMRSHRSPTLSVPQFRVLAFLNHHPGASLSEVAEHLGVTRATASTMTDRLVQRGLVDRVESPFERRHIMLKLTELGNSQLQQMQEVTCSRISELLGGLTSEELTRMSETLVKLEKIFRAACS
ncbi:hypothetical protein BST81_03485 [Leptolyngbya sp. 'hensonii']|uniref:MarR family winged helix-turn-helix transcriptional regulator n=1 Tax=Leptolyngbya sp. 'hensonii' TaxID=1922337 RepID=UPI000950322C|nr:MarR family transcriptional regulator [Leptolyngbya sp. 'hensonii']OLP19849.1 hypothetical protein BST81_03485 [Leptolyngbya sp. 'hensonii']